MLKAAQASGGCSAAHPCSKPQVIVLTGPTAVGKTNASLALAEKIGGEIISADSVQVYTGLDVGSDKILPAERRGIPHHLLDILSPREEFSAGDFYARARTATADILQRGKVPIVTGGTGFYLRWFIHGKPRTPVSTAQTAKEVEDFLKQAWEDEADRIGRALTAEEQWEVGRVQVAALGDPFTAERLKEVPGNYYRLNRVLEIVLATRRPLAELDLDTEAPLDYDFRCFFLNRPRVELYRRIDARCEEMVVNGLLQEAAWLLEEGLVPEDKCAARAIGYRQAMEFLQRCRADPSHISADSLVQLVRDIQKASRNLCHRQLSWFRDEPLFQWVDAAREPAIIVDDIVAELAKEVHTGSSGDDGKLSKEEERELKSYITQLQLFQREDVVQRCLATVKQLAGAS
ncbi:g7821 [Coccomyxa elongata]